MPDPDGPAPPLPLPRSLRALQRLVTALTAVMIVGFVVLIAALVLRLNASGPDLPASVALPAGAEAAAFTQGSDWFAVVTTDDRILIYDRFTGRLRQEIAVERGGAAGTGRGPRSLPRHRAGAQARPSGPRRGPSWTTTASRARPSRRRAASRRPSAT